MNTKTDNLRAILSSYGKLAVAFSGGVDSSVLLACAAKTLGVQNVLAVRVDTPFMPSREKEIARSVCRVLNIRLSEIELAIPSSLENNPKGRCYLCKLTLFKAIANEAKKNGFDILADGTNADDSQDDRPGMRAIEELCIKSPLRESGLGKEEIREIAGKYKLETAEHPADSCLLTRLPMGRKIEPEKLVLIDNAENFLRDLGYSFVRVRVMGDDARIELEPEDISNFVLGGNTKVAFKRLKEMGFNHVSLDLGGYKMGSMNQA